MTGFWLMFGLWAMTVGWLQRVRHDRDFYERAYIRTARALESQKFGVR